jgi:hypothetical protein
MVSKRTGPEANGAPESACLARKPPPVFGPWVTAGGVVAPTMVTVVVAVEPVRHLTVTSKVPGGVVFGMVTSASSNVFQGWTVTMPNALEVTVAELELSPQLARTCTVNPGVVLLGLTCTQTPLRTEAVPALAALALAPDVKFAQALRTKTTAANPTAPNSMRSVRIVVPPTWVSVARNRNRPALTVRIQAIFGIPNGLR